MNPANFRTGPGRGIGSTSKLRPATWSISLASLFLAMLLCSTSAWPQAEVANSMPAWTVLVLKLVSATHVQPTTGIVIAAPDLVLVAADFARPGDEIMVLDGGTDIVRNGRPASIVHTLPADKLAILKVQGLSRPAAQLSAVNLASIQSLQLVGFPPAEMIALGAAPVRAQVKTLAAITTAWPTLDPFPNVSAALTDDCGRLVAFNLPSGLQDMQPANSPRLAWTDALKRAAELTGTAVPSIDCSTATDQDKETAAAEAAQEEVAAPTPDPAIETETEPEVEPEAAPAVTEQEALQPENAAGEVETERATPEPSTEEIAVEELAEIPEETAIEGKANSDSQTFDEDLAAASNAPGSSSIIGWAIAILTGLAMLGWWLFRRRKKPAGESGSWANPPAIQTPVEPGTVRFEMAASRAAGVWLKVTGLDPEGGTFNRHLPVSGPGWMAELGRQEADFDLESPTVSRRHARLELHEGRIIITDLDSTNGTRVNGVPCLPGEVFFVQADDVVQLGDVKLSLQLTANEDQKDDLSVGQ